MKKLFMKIAAFFQKESGEKTVIDKKKLGIFLVIFLLVIVCSWFMWTWFTNDTSVLMKTTASAKEQARSDDEKLNQGNDEKNTGTVSNSQVLGNVPKSTKPSRKAAVTP